LVRYVETYPPQIVANDRYVGVLISPDVEVWRTDASLWVDDHKNGAIYFGRQILVVGQSADGASGTLRIASLERDAGDAVELVPGGAPAALVSWRCNEPLAPGDELEPPVKPGYVVRSGTASLELRPDLLGPAQGEVTCVTIEDVDPPIVSGVYGIVSFDGGHAILRIDSSTVLVGIVRQDGQYEGEYFGEVHSRNDYLGPDPGFVDAPSAEFLPTDPAYLPLGGADGPRAIGVRVEFTCGPVEAQL
jgi:hypothetical protein